MKLFLWFHEVETFSGEALITVREIFINSRSHDSDSLCCNFIYTGFRTKFRAQLRNLNYEDLIQSNYEVTMLSKRQIMIRERLSLISGFEVY